MADNVSITPGSGVTVLADEVTDGTLGTGVVQFVKLMDGTVNGTTKSSIGADGLLVNQSRAATSTRTSVSSAAADTLLLAANTSRKQAKIFNDSASVLYLGEGTAAASSSDFTIKMDAGGYYETVNYTGQIRGRWATADGAARITELT